MKRPGSPLNSKTFDVRLAPIESRGGLMTKDHLLSRVWPGQAVEEGNLTVHVSALRKALGERRGGAASPTVTGIDHRRYGVK